MVKFQFVIFFFFKLQIEGVTSNMFFCFVLQLHNEKLSCNIVPQNTTPERLVLAHL